MDVDSLKSAIIGSGGLSIQHMEFLPELVRLSVGLITIVYFVYKIMLIKKQLKE
jgi:hypothetical protein|tara:strand:- start:882 stop:1043 length:162 start_codon:yes stop_codon:yes gene_type:complete